jgi:succinate dehydrogenase (ubiquinone) cytochrome b560 subunit
VLRSAAACVYNCGKLTPHALPRLSPQLVAKRPVSPHVFEITGVQPHYKFPLGAISSITNRATGCMLSVGTWAAAYIALTGDLGAAINAFKEAAPLLVFPAKAVVAFPLIYHYLGGLRHVYWDHAKYGNQVPLRLSLLSTMR